MRYSLGLVSSSKKSHSNSSSHSDIDVGDNNDIDSCIDCTVRAVV